MAAKTTKAKTGRATRSRAEVQSEFENINAAYAEEDAVDPKTAAASRARASGIRSAVHGVTVEGAVTAVTQVSLSVQKALAGVNEQLLSKVGELEEVREAVELEKAELAELHKIDIAATSIDILIQDHATKAKALEEEYAQKERDFQAREIERTKAQKTAEAEYALRVQREKDEYEYRKTTERRNAEDEFSQKLLLKQREAADQQATLEKTWRERENVLRAEETEVLKLRQEVFDLPTKLRADFEKEKGAAIGAVKSTLEHTHALKEKDFDAESRVQKGTIATLETQLKTAQEQIKALQTQLDAANAKIESIATKAIDGAAKRDAFDQFMNVTREQGANSTTGRAKS